MCYGQRRLYAFDRPRKSTVEDLGTTEEALKATGHPDEIKKLKADNLKIDGPCPADTAFLKKNIQKYDVILTMYHDQGLPVIKFNDFKNTVNITLGLPITRVSVDHGVALELVGSNKIDISSFAEALKVAKKYSI